ncbi:hypothetical protein MBRA1_003758 [Malassezia brasiliensis]|uniref:LIM zinc-binding domain-containing protein n=1 Tax=Malassezia brasiliensis TaxID=1821822 RepID=A0AAF0DX28_9BASI|nr:hypothetical protein MBRA1_003758 [Malassezia brasiliensis]
MPVRSRPLPTPAGPLHASPSAYEVFRSTPETPPPVPAKPPRDSPSAALTKSASLRQQADLLMQRGSPSRAGHRRTQSATEARPLPTPPTPLSDARHLENAQAPVAAPVPSSLSSPVGVKSPSPHTHTSPPTLPRIRGRPLPSPHRGSGADVAPASPTAHAASPSVRGSPGPAASPSVPESPARAASPARPPLPPSPAPRAAPMSPHARRPAGPVPGAGHAAHPFSPPPRSPHVRAHTPVAARATSPLRHTQPVPSTDDVFSSPGSAARGAPLVPTRPEPRRPSAPRVPPRVGGARAPVSPAAPAAVAPRPFLARPTTPPGTLGAPARPETPTRSRTPEGGVPRIARTPSPVRSVRPYEMVPAVPGGPPVPLLLIEGEELTDALMDPGAEVGDATVSFDESAAALPQHAARARTEGDVPSDADDASDVSLTSSVVCAGCKRGIVGPLVHAMDAAWHARCFVCAACATPLEHVSFYAHDGRPYCHLDYHERFARRCFYCETPIIDERFVTIDDARLGQRSYHELHFFCAGCGDPFFEPRDAPSPGAEAAPSATEGGKPFFVHGAHPYCDACHTRLHRPKCQACRGPIDDEVVHALRADWHPACFVCTRCHTPLHDAEVYRGPDGAPCDRACYEAWLCRAH